MTCRKMCILSTNYQFLWIITFLFNPCIFIVLCLFQFSDDACILLSGIQFKQLDAGGDQIIVGVSQTDDVFCLNKDSNNVGPSSDAPWTQLTGKLSYYSCGPYSCWGVNSAGNIFLRRVKDSGSFMKSKVLGHQLNVLF